MKAGPFQIDDESESTIRKSDFTSPQMGVIEVGS
jgi:hypothetical protein